MFGPMLGRIESCVFSWVSLSCSFVKLQSLFSGFFPSTFGEGICSGSTLLHVRGPFPCEWIWAPADDQGAATCPHRLSQPLWLFDSPTTRPQPCFYRLEEGTLPCFKVTFRLTQGQRHLRCKDRGGTENRPVSWLPNIRCVHNRAPCALSPLLPRGFTPLAKA